MFPLVKCGLGSKGMPEKRELIHLEHLETELQGGSHRNSEVGESSLLIYLFV